MKQHPPDKQSQKRETTLSISSTALSAATVEELDQHL